MSKTRAPSFSKADSAACSRKIVGRAVVGEGVGRSPCGGATSATIHQSGRASPGGGRNGALAARCGARNW